MKRIAYTFGLLIIICLTFWPVAAFPPTPPAPQALAPGDSPTFNGVTLSGLTASKPVFTDANKALSSSGTVPDGNIAAALTGKTYNALTLTAAATGFTVAGGTTSKTLTVALDANVAGTNTGDVTLANPDHGLGLTNQVLTLGTPSSITGASTNAVTTTSHTHALDLSAPPTIGGTTPGIVNGLVPVQTINGTGAITACAGHSIVVTSAGTVTLPDSATVGQRCTILSTTAAVVSVDVASASFTMVLNGTALTAGNKATSDGTDETELTCEMQVANTWRCKTSSPVGAHVDGG